MVLSRAVRKVGIEGKTMSLRPADTSWEKAARNVASGLAMLGITALGGGARAQEAAVEPISQVECWEILTAASMVVGEYHNKLDARFTSGLAKLIAPTKTAPLYSELIHKAILDGSVTDLVESKKPAAIKWQEAAIPVVTCTGPKIIPTPDGAESAASLGIRMWLVAGENPIRLDKKGVFFRHPAEVVGMKR
jgi:hypothetical protein